MPACLPRRIGVTTGTALTAALFLWGAAPAFAQNRVGSGGGFGGGSGGGGGFGGGGSFSGGGGSFSGGGGFSGGSMGGGSFSGGSGNFTGTSYAPSQFTGTGTTGGQGFGGGALGGTSGGIQPSNVLGAYYANPYAAGIQNTGRASAFGTPIYNTTTTVSQSTTLGVGARGAGGSPGGAGVGVGALGGGRAPAYTAVIGFSRPVAAPTQIQADVQQVLARSSSISQNRAIRVDLVGSAVVLRGMVADDHDRALAEGLARMTPGVRDVRNELQTLAGLPPAAPGQ